MNSFSSKDTIVSQFETDSLINLLKRVGPRGVALLRSEEFTADKVTKTGDWDIAVSDKSTFGQLLKDSYGEPDLRITRQYVEQWFYSWNQVDLLPVFEWNGLDFLDQNRFWKGVSNGRDGIPRPRLAHDALIAWMTGVLGGKTYNPKYDSLIAQALDQDKDEFESALNEAFGSGWTEFLMDWAIAGNAGEAAKHSKDLRRALFFNKFKRDAGGCLSRQISHWYIEAKHHLHPPYPWVAMLGPDGSGKSSVIEGLTHKLSHRRLSIKMIHWSPRLLRKGQEVPGGIVPDPHSIPPRNLFMSILKLGLITAEWWWASIWNIRHPRAKSKLLISDRYYNDMLVDPVRYRFGAPIKWAKFVFRFLPKPDHVIVLAGDADQILARKKEVTPEELKRQLAAYKELAVSLGDRATVVDCCQPLNTVVDESYELILEAFRERSRNLPTVAKVGSTSFSDSDQTPALPLVQHKPPVEAHAHQSGDGRLKVLISAYGCSPSRGSEANVAWNLVRQLSEKHDLCVMTRAINKPVIEESSEQWVGRIQWVYFDPPSALTFWRRGKRGVSLYYAWWQILARSKAKQLISEQHFDVAHHITIGTYLFPSLISDLGVPLLFGPVGGGDQTPPGLANSFRWMGAFEEWMRATVRNLLEKFEYLHHYYISNAWTLAATPATENALRRMGVRRTSMMPQSATGDDNLEAYIKAHPPVPAPMSGPLELVTACRLVHWKAVDIALEAVAAVKNDGLDVRLTILEHGPELSHLQHTAKKLGINECVNFVGRLESLEEVFGKISSADALLHPALHEAFGQACLEALALGKPVICLDWGGPGLIVNDRCGYKIKPASREDSIAGFADAIRKLAAEKSSGRNFTRECIKRAKDFQWDTKAEEIDGFYRQILVQENARKEAPNPIHLK
ncbi:hypothetical protein NT6N_17910 [Oceaniferula spumae]|uniref:Glycosyl transferase family 1 domain-containing protein n=1 Tax=Oceaniferula spumae TaxID=2979115 RepID=A0AAT9FLE1_9BACT